MVHCDLVALCLGLIGLIGASAVTGLPMWKVTAFIGENIIVMETRWEGLWMNCYRQASIRMQCKVYDSLLYLPADLQAARGLMCCAVALSGLGLLVSLLGLRSTLCLRDQPRVKSIISIVAGVMEILASLCVIIPVSWTANTIIRDFYNPLLIDAQRRELGEALYIGWVTSAFLMASGVLFLCRRIDQKTGSVYPRRAINKPVSNHVQTLNSTTHQPLLQNNNSLSIHQPSTSTFSFAVTPSNGQHSFYNMNPMTSVYCQNVLPPPNPILYGQNVMQSQYVSRNNQFPPQLSTQFYGSSGSDPFYSSFSAGSPFHPSPQKPVFIGYNCSHVQSHSSDSSSGLRI